MAIDTSIFAQANKPTVALQDPQTVLQNAAASANAVMQNRLLQANQTRGQLAQQAIDPDTGQFDPAKFNRLLGQTPSAALAASDAIQQSQGLMGQQQDLATRQNAILQQTLGSVAALPDDQIHAGASAALGRIVSQGLMKPQDAYYQMAHLSNDPQAMRRQLLTARMSLMGPDQQTAATVGAASTQDNGQSVQPGMVAGPLSGSMGGVPGGAFNPAGPATQVYPSRSTLINQTPGVDAAGRPTQQPLGGRLIDQGRPDLAGPAGTPPGTVPSSLLPPGYTGRYAAPRPAPATPTLTPAAPSVPAPMPNLADPRPAALPPGPTGSVVTGLAPGQAAALQAQATSSAAAFQDIANQGVQAKSQNATLGNMLGDTASFTSGQTGVNNFKATIQRQAPAIAGLFGLDPAKVAANESFDKLANQIAGAQGAGSDARLAVAQGGNPSSHLSAAGVDQMLRQLQGNSDYLQARAKIASAYPNQADRAGFEAGPAAQLDPRAFQFDRLTQPQKQAYVAGLSPQDRVTLRAAYNHARGQGLIDAPAAANAPPAAVVAPAAVAPAVPARDPTSIVPMRGD